MPKRYFYTNPIKAAWMAKEFGFKFGMGSRPFNNGLMGAFSPLSVESLVNAGWGEPIYIHPDCHEMLKAQVGDLVKLFDGHHGIIKGCNPKGGYDASEGYYGMMSEKEIITWITPTITDIQIIQRNGKAFFVPEVEEIE